MGPMDILLLALLLLWAVLALRRMRRHGSCGCGSCHSRCCCGGCGNPGLCPHCPELTQLPRRSGRARREVPGDGAPLPFAKSENRTK